MAEQIKTRIIHKHDLEANWNKAEGFVPKQGEIIIYDIEDGNYSYERIKIGDGKTPVTLLPFTTKELVAGANITLTPNTIGDKITIVAKDTTYQNATTTSAGLMSAADKVNLNNSIDKIENKVDKEEGKGLSTNDYTTTEKNKLAGIATGATKVLVDSTITSESTNAVQSGAVYTALSNKVSKEEGKSLTSNDFTDAYVSKLDTISTGAEVNQNAFSNITIGSTTITADTKTDTLTLVAGTNITLTPDATNDKITITATDTKLALDTNLNTSGKAADAKVVGDKFTTLEEQITDIDGEVISLKKVVDIVAEDPNDTTLDRISEIVDYIQDNKELIDSITINKQNTITGAATTITSSDLTASRVLISDSNGKIAASSSVTTTELGYLDGVTSSIQNQLDNKLGTTELKVSVTGTGNAITTGSYDSSTKTITLDKGATFNNYSLPVATSSALGGVKSGGDITIASDGTVSVNDDSHAHVISNIDNLQNTLDAKLNTTDLKVTTSGTGNAATAISYDSSTKTITLTKDATYNNYSLPSAGSSLGGVKTGGDVSISSGTITVNSASKVKNNLVVKLNSGTTEGTNMFTFNGSAAKTIDITPDKVGAMAVGVTIDGGTWS